MQRLKELQAERALRVYRVEELYDYLMAQEANFIEFDEGYFAGSLKRLRYNPWLR